MTSLATVAPGIAAGIAGVLLVLGIDLLALLWTRVRRGWRRLRARRERRRSPLTS